MTYIITEEDHKAVREYVAKGETAMPFERVLDILDKLQRVEVVGYCGKGDLGYAYSSRLTPTLQKKLYAVKETP